LTIFASEAGKNAARTIGAPSTSTGSPLTMVREVTQIQLASETFDANGLCPDSRSPPSTASPSKGKGKDTASVVSGSA